MTKIINGKHKSNFLNFQVINLCYMNYFKTLKSIKNLCYVINSKTRIKLN